MSLAKTLSSSYLWIWNNAFYNSFFFFLHLVICRCTFTNRAWSVCMYMYPCMAYLASPKYMTVAGQMKGFTVFITVYIYCHDLGSFTWVGWGCSNFTSRTGSLICLITSNLISNAPSCWDISKLRQDTSKWYRIYGYKSILFMVLWVFTDILLMFTVSMTNNGQWATGHLAMTVKNWQQPKRQCFTEIYTQTNPLPSTPQKNPILN